MKISIALYGIDVNDVSLQQVNAKCHLSHATIDLLYRTFDGHLNNKDNWGYHFRDTTLYNRKSSRNLIITILQSGLRHSFSHYLCCMLVLYMNGITYSLKSISNVKYFRNFSSQFYLPSVFLPEEVAEEIFVNISFCWTVLTWGLNYCHTFNTLHF